MLLEPADVGYGFGSAALDRSVSLQITASPWESVRLGSVTLMIRETG